VRQHELYRLLVPSSRKIRHVGDVEAVYRELAIPLAEIALRTSRSSGPGGQHANVTASRVEAIFDVLASPSLSEMRRSRLLARAGPRLVAVAQDERSQSRNRELALARLAERLARALKVPRSRRPPRTPAGGQAPGLPAQAGAQAPAGRRGMTARRLALHRWSGAGLPDGRSGDLALHRWSRGWIPRWPIGWGLVSRSLPASPSLAQQILEGSAAHHRGGLLGDHVRPRACLLVAPLEQQPLGLPARPPGPRALQHETAAELLAV
jgi:ribosome-associated protein